MVTEIEEPNAGADGTWNNPQNVYLSNPTVCTNDWLNNPGSTTSSAQLEEFTLTGAYQITATHFQTKHTIEDMGFGIKLSRDGGSTWCSAYHYPTLGGTGCATASWSGWIECTHDFSSITVAQARSNDLKVLWNLTHMGDPTGIVWIKAIQVRLTFDSCTTPGTPGAPTAAALSTTSIRITKPSNPSPAGTQWQARQTNDSWSSAWTANGTSTVDNTTGLSAGTQYTYDTRFRDTSNCTGPYGSDISRYTLCATPANPTISNPGVGQLKIDWVTVTGVAEWNVDWSANGTSGWTPVSGSPFTPATLTTTQSGIGNGVLRYYRVNAENPDSAASAWSGNGSGTTWDYPTVPQNLSITNV